MISFSTVNSSICIDLHLFLVFRYHTHEQIPTWQHL
eukprot:UN01605